MEMILVPRSYIEDSLAVINSNPRGVNSSIKIGLRKILDIHPIQKDHTDILNFLYKISEVSDFTSQRILILDKIGELSKINNDYDKK
jgi:hypothetical protein